MAASQSTCGLTSPPRSTLEFTHISLRAALLSLTLPLSASVVVVSRLVSLSVTDSLDGFLGRAHFCCHPCSSLVLSSAVPSSGLYILGRYTSRPLPANRPAAPLASPAGASTICTIVLMRVPRVRDAQVVTSQSQSAVTTSYGRAIVPLPPRAQRPRGVLPKKLLPCVPASRPSLLRPPGLPALAGPAPAHGRVDCFV